MVFMEEEDARELEQPFEERRGKRARPRRARIEQGGSFSEEWNRERRAIREKDALHEVRRTHATRNERQRLLGIRSSKSRSEEVLGRKHRSPTSRMTTAQRGAQNQRRKQRKEKHGLPRIILLEEG
ncbi:hypothetical protein KM043_011822 [Ampulex compressa]|nr:hypothetical protein KM043_011822 [Ampulex compressa]